MKKKGQVTFYIIIGLFIILLGFVGYYVLNLHQEPSTAGNLASQKDALQLQLQSCIESMVKEYLIYFGAGGGASMFTFSPASVEVGIPNWYLNGKNELPSLIQMEESADELLPLLIYPYCTQEFEKQGFETDVSMLKVKTTFGDDIKVIVNHPISLTKGKDEIVLDNVALTVPVRMKHLYEIAYKVIEHQREDPDFVDITFLNSFDVDVVYAPQNEQETLVLLTDQLSHLDGEPYTFQFGMYFGDEQATPNAVPHITTKQTDFKMYVGKQFQTTITADDRDGDAVFFSVFPPFFPINPETGVITFTPGPEHTGMYDMVVTVSDNRNASSQTFTVTIA